jgi:hypothetical protein
VRSAPPPKRAGRASGRRRLDGAVKDVAGVAAFLGTTEKAVRAQIARGLLPHRRLGGRVVVIADELVEYLRRLPGVTLDEAVRNVATRAGDEVVGR